MKKKIAVLLTDQQIGMVLGCLYETKPIIDASELALWSETNAIFENAENDFFLDSL
jgi:hypothetical protein